RSTGSRAARVRRVDRGVRPRSSRLRDDPEASGTLAIDAVARAGVLAVDSRTRSASVLTVDSRTRSARGRPYTACPSPANDSISGCAVSPHTVARARVLAIDRRTATGPDLELVAAQRVGEVPVDVDDQVGSRHTRDYRDAAVRPRWHDRRVRDRLPGHVIHRRDRRLRSALRIDQDE